MPMPESEISYHDMQEAVKKGYLCAKCGSILTIAWGGDGYILRCGKDINHAGITRHDKKYEKEIKEVYSMDSTALTKMTETQMVERVEMARFPQEMTKQDKILLAQVAITYGLDPLMGEVTLYQGRPFVSIDGRYRKAQETEQLDGVETRPANKQERADWQIPEGDFFYRSEVYVKGSSRPFVAWGRVFHAETVGGKGFKPVEKNPQRMAEKRAEAQALRKAFHIPLPSVEDIGSPDYDVESTAVEVDKTTGEITEGKTKGKPAGEIGATEKKPQPKTAEPEPEKQQEVSPETAPQVLQPTEGQESIIDLAWLKESLERLDWVGVVKWLNDKYHLNGRKVSEIVKQLTPEQAKEFADEVQSRLEMA